jgi:Mn2+/Fe2+ NRAMP family transporter
MEESVQSINGSKYGTPETSIIKIFCRKNGWKFWRKLEKMVSFIIVICVISCFSVVFVSKTEILSIQDRAPTD